VNASSAAHSAASLAFLANRPSTPSLSASAAAQALRTMSPGPTNVAQVQTRRTLQRQHSGSSTGSASRGRGQALQRRDSGGSMTERTFRTPSPHGAGPNGQQRYPPVPQIPENYNNVPPIPAKSHRRTNSLEPPPRVFSPPPAGPAGRGVSLDRAGNAQPSKTKARISSLQNINELERSDSNNSQNFSYPGRARPMSPTARSPAVGQHATASPAQRASGAAAAAAAGVQYDVTRASEQPVRKKKKKVVRGAAEGSHLEQGGMGIRPIVTPLATGPAPNSQSAAGMEQQNTPEKKKKKKVAAAPTGEGSHLPAAARPMSPSYGSDSDSTPEKAQKRGQRASGQLNKQPSVVREDWEGEQAGGPALGSPARLREEQGLSPVSSPANIQAKKASTAANVSKKIDEAATSAKAENQPVYNAVTVPQAANKQHLAVAENGAPTTRTTSLSPSRSMRFSDRLSTDLTAGRRHEPLPRSVSPAKSALKHHSPSPTDPLFPGRYIHSQTASEASDNASNVSADGVGPYKKKKSARVSFDAEPEIVGSAAGVDQTETPILASPQDKISGKKGWFGLGKSKAVPALGTIAAEDELEEVMKPRPALPAFGSVRRGGRDTSDSTPSIYAAPSTGTTAPTSSTMSSASSEASTASQIPTLDTSISSDHAIGSLLAQEAAKPKTSEQQLPLPPEVTSKEGLGYLSDTESELSQDGRQAENLNQTDVKEDSNVLPTTTPVPSAPVAAPAPLEHVPTVTLQPPTPALDRSQSDEWLMTIPGGFPASTDALTNIPTPEPEASRRIESTSPAGLGIAEPTPAETISAASPTETPLDSLHRQSQEQDDDGESSAGDSIYSDAAEEASEHGDGFGSINAIVESPVVRAPATRIITPPESPLARVSNQDRPDSGARTASWDHTQSHWSGIAQASREGIQPKPARQEQVAEMPAQPVVESYADKKPSMKKKKKKIAAPPQQSLVPESPPSRSLPQSSPYPRVAPTDIPAPPPFRHSMRAQKESDQPHFRSSMRQRPQSAAQPVARPASPPVQQAPPPKKPRGALQKRNIPPAVVTPAAVTMAARAAATERPPQPAPQAQNKKLQRTMSNDSDSDSSFKKRHRRGASGASSQGGMMRRSMRAPPESQPAIPAGRGGIRSMSPPVSRRPMSPTLGNKTMRTSMRQGIEPQAPTLRSQPQQQRSSSMFGRRKNKSPPPAQRAGPLPLTKKLTSRFADSDDEDDAGPRTFRSRFEDSSDDEGEAIKYRPVRGIPRKADDGDSTDLDDSDDEKKTASKPQGLTINPTQANGASKSTDLPSSPTSSTAKKAGFFSRFRSKKEKDLGSQSKLGGTIAERNARLEHNRPAVEAAKQEEKISTPQKKEDSDKKQASRLGFSSIAERDRVLEQTRQKLEEARGQQGDLRPSLSSSGRQKPERIMSDSWPLPPKMPVIAEDRPNTADGVALPAAEVRPGTSGRQPSYGRSGKKKRFPALRKAFGLND
jgi:serine/arginine repetitive matrix protein 2